MIDPWVVPAAMTGASAVGSIFAKKKKNSTPYEVVDAWNQLRRFGRTGKLGDYTAGADFGGDLGNYDKSIIETTGQGKLLDLIKSARPEMFDAATNELKNLLSTDLYDPYSERGLFKGFSRNVDRETRESTNALKRSAAFGGNLYSRDTFRRMGDLEEQGLNQKSNKLAELYDTFAQRRLSAVPLAAQLGQAQEGIDMGRINSAFQFGGLDRSLADAKSKALYADFLRKQGEKSKQIDAYKAVAGGFQGDTYSPSPYEGVLSMLSTLGGYGLMNSIGKGGSEDEIPSSGGGYLPPRLSLRNSVWNF